MHSSTTSLSAITVRHSLTRSPTKSLYAGLILLILCMAGCLPGLVDGIFPESATTQQRSQESSRKTPAPATRPHPEETFIDEETSRDQNSELTTTEARVRKREESVREHLGKAEIIRARLFREGASAELRIRIPDGEVLTRRLLKYRIDQIQQARWHYEEVTKMEPDKLQAILGLGNLALMEAMTYISRREKLIYDLKLAPDGTDRKETQRKQIEYRRRIDLATRAAIQKFERVLQIRRSDTNAHLGIAIALAMAHRWKPALAKFQEIERVEILNTKLSRISVAYAWYGFVLEHMSSIQKAKEKYMIAAEIRDPYVWAEWAASRLDHIEIHSEDFDAILTTPTATDTPPKELPHESDAQR